MPFLSMYVNRCWSPAIRQILLAAALIVSATSCTDALGPAPDPNDPSLLLSSPGGTALEVIPAGPLELTVGDSVTLKPVGASASRELVFTSTDTLVARVSSSGLLTARVAGDARILLTSKRSPRAFGSVIVRVESRGPSTIELRRFDMTKPAPTDLQNLSRSFAPQFALRRGDAARLEVTVNGVVLCTNNLSPRAASADSVPELVTCPVNTAAVDSATSKPLVYNGPAEVAARLVRIDGSPLATVAVGQGRLNNQDAVLASITAGRAATDQAGKRWYTGDLVVSAVPVSYTKEVTFVRVDVEIAGAGRSWKKSLSSAPSVARFIDLAPGEAISELRLNVTAHSSEAKDIIFSSPVFGYDASAPAVGSLEPREWIGAELAFASLYTAARQDEGIGGVHLQFYAAPSGTSQNEIFTNARRVERGGDFAASGSQVYDLGFLVCDALENCSRGSGFSFRVDVEPPTLSLVSIPSRSINPDVFTLRVNDVGSGLDAQPLEVVAQALMAGATQAQCGPVIEASLDLPGGEVAGVCRPDRLGHVIPLPQSSAGYYTYRVVAIDQAGNRSVPLDRHVIVDRVRPGLSSFTIGSALVAGEDAVMSSQVVDNLDLASVSYALSFSRAGVPRLTLPFTTINVGAPFSGKLTRSATAEGKLQVVRSLTTGTRGNADRATAVVDSIFAEVTDAAQLRFRTGRALSFSSIGGGNIPSDPFAAVVGATISLPGRVCTFGCTASETAGPASVRVVADAGVAALSRMYLFARDGDGRVVLLGSGADFKGSATGTQLIYTYSLTLNAPSNLEGTYTVFAIGVSGGGNALKSNDVEVEFFGR